MFITPFMSLEQKVRLFGKEYPVKSFCDRGTEMLFPYATENGAEHPIILSSVVVIKQADTYLMVKENDKGLVLRNDAGKYAFPGGQCAYDEDLVAAAIREVHEETAYNVNLVNLIGVYKRINKRQRMIYKAAFRGEILNRDDQALASDVASTHLFSEEEIHALARKNELKTSDIMVIFRDYLRGKQYALDNVNSSEVINNLPNEV